METKIKVTQEDIKKANEDIAIGKRRAKSCPIAQALKRQNVKFIGVITNAIELSNGCISLPEKAISFIRAYCTSPPKLAFRRTSFSFNINIPKEYLSPKTNSQNKK